MITNERQLQISKAQIDRFEASLKALSEGSASASDVHPLVKQAQIDAITSQIASLRAEVSEYERLKSGKVRDIAADSLADLPIGIIRARIAAGLTQRDLADRLGMREQQIQRYEANLYEGASLSRVAEIADAIGLSVTNILRLIGDATPEQFLKRLGSAGLDSAFVKRRIAPNLAEPANDLGPAISRVGKIFDWDADELMSTGPLEPPRLAVAMARFKMPKGRDARSVAAYTAYAHRLAEICATAMSAQPRLVIPTRWREFRRQVVERYGDVTLFSALQFAWDLGVVVLPLNDAGAFHGAHWRIRGVNIIILKQSTRFPARWLFDLLHELYHAGQEPEAAERELVELPETSDERRNSDEERGAMFFAGNVGLNGRAEELTNDAIGLADGDLRRLKRAAATVARQCDADISLLANYVAYRLSLQGENWWGAAANLQEVTCDPLALARDAFFDRFQFGALADDDLELLRLALHDEVRDG